MEKKQPKPVPPADGPVKVFRVEDVSASVFARTRKVQREDVTFFSVSFSRSYKDASGMRKYTKSFDSDCLGQLATVLQQASEFIHEQRNAKS